MPDRRDRAQWAAALAEWFTRYGKSAPVLYLVFPIILALLLWLWVWDLLTGIF